MNKNLEIFNRDQEIEKLMFTRELKIIKARVSFFDFCQAMSPDFYKKNRLHLKLLCSELENLYYGKTKSKKLIITMPPRHGKSRTLVLFCMWSLGKNFEHRIITCSYNDDLAMDFSRYTRDGINEKKTFPYEIDYSDIFPDIRVSKDNASYGKWALEGQFFNYKGAGVGGSITGKGCSISIVDDPVKDAETAMNENALDKIWRWYTGTFLSRLEEGAIQIVNMTRWANKDIVGRLLDSSDSKEWNLLKMPIKTGDKMLCPELLSQKSYESKKRNMDHSIFQANYYGEPIDLQGCLYKDLKTYSELPKDTEGNFIYDHIINYTDTADEGDCFLCSIDAVVNGKDIYLINAYYTQDGMEITEQKTAEMLNNDNVNIAHIESNNGGKGFARQVIAKLLSLNSQTVVIWFHQSANKIARILSNAFYIMENVYFPVGWRHKWPLFYKAITEYQRQGKNKYNDAPDTLTGLVEKAGLGKARALKMRDIL